MAIYSHVRRKALNEAAAALEPEAAPSPLSNEPATSAEGVTSYVTSQSAPTRRNVLEFPRKSWLAALDDFRNWLVREAA